MKNKSIIIICTLVILGIATALSGTAGAKSLYTIAAINGDPTPIEAYDIQPNGSLIFQAAYGVPYYAGGAVGIAIDSDSAVLFVTYEFTNVIQLLDATTMGDLGTAIAPGAGNLAGIVVDQDKQLLYAVDRDTNHLYVYKWYASNSTLSLQTQLNLANLTQAYGLALDEINDVLYVAEYYWDDYGITYYDTDTWTNLGKFATSHQPQSIAVDAENQFVYTGSGKGSSHLITKYNISNATEITKDIGESALGMAVDPATNLLYCNVGVYIGPASTIRVYDSDLNELYSTYFNYSYPSPTGMCIPGKDVSYNPLNLTKDDGLGDGCISPGDYINYTICFDNLNDYNVTNVILVDTLPDNVTFIAASGGVECCDGLVTWNFQEILQGEGDCVWLLVQVNDTILLGTIITNQVTIDSDETPPTTQSEETMVCEAGEDTEPPVTTKTIGFPQYGGGYFITSDTPIILNATDPGENASGVKEIHYIINGEEFVHEGDEVTFTLEQECVNTIEFWAVDNAENVENSTIQDHFVDTTGPEQTIEFGDPKDEHYYEYLGVWYTGISGHTPVWINSTDIACDVLTGVGSDHITYEFYWGEEFGDWTFMESVTVYDNFDENDVNPNEGEISIMIYFNESCFHEVHYWCYDKLGNRAPEPEESYLNIDFLVDADAPISEREYIGPSYGEFISCDTYKVIDVWDIGCIEGGSGVERVEWHVDKHIGGEVWVLVDEGVVYDNDENDSNPNDGEIEIHVFIGEDCEHHIYDKAYDNFGNTVAEHKEYVKVDCTPPEIYKIVGDPNCTIDSETYCVTTWTPINISAEDFGCLGGVGIKTFEYNIWYDGEWQGWEPADPNGQDIFFSEECLHYLLIRAIDFVDNMAEDNETFYVDDSPPVINKTVGDPNCEIILGQEYCITPETPITIDAYNDGCCDSGLWVEYKINEGDWTPITVPYILYITEECDHTLYIKAWDCLNNTAEDIELFHVDNTTPIINKTVGDPNCKIDNETYCVTLQTPITIDAYDLGCCPNLTVEYRVDGGGWIQVDVPFIYRFPEPCQHTLDIKAYDCLGHISYDNETFYVDDSYPIINKTVGDPNCTIILGEEYCVTTQTPIEIDAYDPGCCPGLIVEYKVDGGNWINITSMLPYTHYFTQECTHILYIRAYDCLGHYTYDNQTFHVDDKPPIIEKTVGEPKWPGSGGQPDWYITSNTIITIDAYEDGCCGLLTYVAYQINDSEWIEITGCLPHEITIPEDCVHTLNITAYDCLYNTAYDNETFYVDNVPPDATKQIGQPNIPIPDTKIYLISSHTPIWINVTDNGTYPCIVGSVHLYYEIWYQGEWTQYYRELPEGTLVEEIHLTGDCIHYLRFYVEDDLENRWPAEEWHNETFWVDDTPPDVTKEVGQPSMHIPGTDNYYITSETPIWINTTDNGTEPCIAKSVHLYYRIWYNGTWSDIIHRYVPEGTISEEIHLEQHCIHYLEFYVEDNVGNRWPSQGWHNETFYLDEKPPDTTKSFDGPTYDSDYWLRDNDTWVILDAIDPEPCAVGVKYLHVELWFASNGYDIDTLLWSIDIYDNDENDTNPADGKIQYKFQIMEDCLHEIRWYAVDHFGNVEEMPENQANLFFDDFENGLDKWAINYRWWFGHWIPMVRTKNNSYSYDNYYAEIQSKSGIYGQMITSVNTTGYQDIKLSYNARTRNAEPGDWLTVSYRIGDSGVWTQLRQLNHNDWRFYSDSLVGAENQPIVQIEFLMNCDYDYGLVDNVLVTGNTTMHVQQHRVDSKPPVIIKTVGEPSIYGGQDPQGHDIWWVTDQTEINLTAYDTEDPCAVGVESIRYKMWYRGNWTDWIEYTGNFTFNEHCTHYLLVNASDHLGNYALDNETFIVHAEIAEHPTLVSPVNGAILNDSSVTLIWNPVPGKDNYRVEWSPTIYFDPVYHMNVTGSELDLLLADGTYYWRVAIIYTGGAIGQWSNVWWFIVDTTPPTAPTLEISDPDLDGYDTDGDITLIWTPAVDDGSGVDYYLAELSMDPTFNTVNIYSGPITELFASFNDLPYDGPWYARVRAVDIAGNPGMWSNVDSIIVDRIEPEVFITNPSPGEKLEGVVPIEYYATDANGISNYEVLIDGESVYSGATNDSYLWDTTEYLDGAHFIKVVATDNPGHTGYDEILVQVDNTPGSVSIIYPHEGESFPEGYEEPVPVTVTAPDNTDYINFTGEFGWFIDHDPEWEYEWDISGYELGEHTITATAYDEEEELIGSDNVTIEIIPESQYRPIFIEITDPEEGEILDSRDDRYAHVIIDAHYFDDPYYQDVEDLTVTLKLDNPYGAPDQWYNVEYNESLQRFTADVDIYKYSNNSDLDLEAKAEDQYSNRAYDDTSFTVWTTIVYDKWMEQEWDSLTIPQGGMPCSHSVESVLASIDGHYEWVFWYNPNTQLWDFYEYGIGGSLTQLETGEEYWLLMTDATRFYTDTNGPSVEIEYPEDGSISNLEEDISGTAFDIETSVTEVRISIYDNDTGDYWDGSIWDSSYADLVCTGTENWYYENTSYINWAGRNGHTINITATATDMAGCSGEDTISFVIDTIPPTSTIDEISDYVNSAPNITGDTSDNVMLDYVEIQLTYNDGSDHYWNFDTHNWVGTETWETIDQTGAYDTWNLSSDDPDNEDYENGQTYDVYAKATDMAGNKETTAHETFTYDDEPPYVEVLDPEDGSERAGPGSINVYAIDYESWVTDPAYLAIEDETEGLYFNDSSSNWELEFVWIACTYNNISHEYEYNVPEPSYEFWTIDHEYNISALAYDVPGNAGMNYSRFTCIAEPESEVSKQVWNETLGDWDGSIQAENDSTVNFNITFWNVGNTPLFELNITDYLPPCLEYEIDSYEIFGPPPEVIENITFTQWGVNNRNLSWEFPELEEGMPIGAGGTILFNATVVSCGENVNVANFSAYCNETEEYVYSEDDATVWAPYYYNISGTIYNHGEETGPIYIYLFDQIPEEGTMPIDETSIPSPGPYTFQVPNGTYYIAACIDVNENGSYDPGEPVGYAINKTIELDPIVVDGDDVDGVDITFNKTYNILGTVYYDGEETGTICIVAFDEPPGEGIQPIAYTYLSSPGPYTLQVPNGTYYILAFMDVNDTGGGPPDEGDLIGFAINKTMGESPDPIVVDGDDVDGVDITLMEQPCDIYATVTYPYYEPIDGDEPLTITGTAIDECGCIEIENVSLALYYTDYSDPQTPTYYWNDSAGEWQWTTILYNPVECVSGGCPDHQINWSFSPDTTFYRPGAVEYYIHVAPRPEYQNQGPVQSAFTVGIPAGDFVGYWKFDEGSGTTAADHSGQSGAGTLYGTPEWTTGIIDDALEFDAIGDFVKLLYADGVEVNGDFTLMAWINATDSTIDRRIMLRSNDIAYITGGILFYTKSNDKLGFNVFDGGDAYGNTVVRDDSWHHIALTYDGSTGLEIFVDGESDGIGSSSVSSASQNWFIGAWFDGNYVFDGVIDEAAIFDKALSVAEIRQCYQNGEYGSIGYLG